MNVVKIMGGLGNQLFQYALSRHLAQYDEIGYDTTHYDTEENKKGLVFLHRDYLLPLFVDDLQIVNDNPDREKVYQWEYDPEKHYKDCWFWGYWQRASYFKDVKLDIRLREQYITLNMRLMAELMHSCNSVAVHVRRTDYGVYNWILPYSYYVRAEDYIRRVVEDPVYFIFSDDMDFVKTNPPVAGKKHYIHNDEIADFWLMSQCKHQIIANSTYSFWAAYLNDNPEKIVVYPKNWHIDINHPVDCLDWKGV